MHPRSRIRKCHRLQHQRRTLCLGSFGCVWVCLCVSTGWLWPSSKFYVCDFSSILQDSEMAPRAPKSPAAPSPDKDALPPLPRSFTVFEALGVSLNLCACVSTKSSSKQHLIPKDENSKGLLLDKGAVAAPQQVLHQQLQAMECLEPSLEVLQQQQQMKQEAREKKAAKQLAKGILSAAMQKLVVTCALRNATSNSSAT